VAQVLSYVRMALPEIEALDRKKTIFLMALSPIEVHGPHLPLRHRYLYCRGAAAALYGRPAKKNFRIIPWSRCPLFTWVPMPWPVQGSLSVPAPLLKKVLLAYVKGLAAQGFRYLFLADNHGGPPPPVGH